MLGFLLMRMTFFSPLPRMLKSTLPCAGACDPMRIPSCNDEPEIEMSSRLLLGLSIVMAAELPLFTEQVNPCTPRVSGTGVAVLRPGPLSKQVLTLDIVRL